MNKPIKPNKPVLADISSKTPSWNRVLWWCYNCDGDGWIYDPHDPVDCIEGNKMRSRITCTVCNGTKSTSRKVFLENIWKPIQTRYNRELEAYRKAAKLYSSIRSKLNSEERKYIGMT